VDTHGINRRPEVLIARTEKLIENDQNRDFPYEIEAHGRKFLVLRNVFAPKSAPAMAGLLSFSPGIDFLEVGTGTGLVAVLAALAGARRVVAVDILPDAVTNTQANAEKHGVSDRLEARVGDVYSSIRPDERFDLIFWNPPYGYVEPERELTLLQRGALDPGYAAIRRYVIEGPNFLKPGGVLTLGFNSEFGRRELVEQAAAEAGLEMHSVQRDMSSESKNFSSELIHMVPRTKR
jgi:release factor glutamine methyltransferase